MGGAVSSGSRGGSILVQFSLYEDPWRLYIILFLGGGGGLGDGAKIAIC